MVRWVRVALSVLLVLALVGCGGEPASEPSLTGEVPAGPDGREPAVGPATPEPEPEPESEAEPGQGPAAVPPEPAAEPPHEWEAPEPAAEPPQEQAAQPPEPGDEVPEPAEPPAPGAADELLPDLVPLPPTNLYLEVTDAGRHLLRFEQGIANAGRGPLRVQGVLRSGNGEVADGVQEILDTAGRVARTVPAASVRFHPHHKHWHADEVAAYELRRDSPWGAVAASNGKVSYCFVDNEPLAGYSGPERPAQFLNCKTSVMGLTEGWVDVYTADLYDQWVDVTGLPDGIYYLVVTVDPGQTYVDATRENNTAWVKVELSGGGREVRVARRSELPGDALPP